MSLRIIGGSLKGRRLYSVRGTTVRPTADRLRESIFNILAFRLQGVVVLDLFAGTGAFGIEALSRGAMFAVFIDNDDKALSVIGQNIQLCALASRVKVIKWNIIKNLNCIRPACAPHLSAVPGQAGADRSARPTFDLVFMDPPYNSNLIKPALLNLHNCRSLERGASIVIEHTLLEPIPEDIVKVHKQRIFTITDQRRYGKTVVSFLSYTA